VTTEAEKSPLLEAVIREGLVKKEWLEEAKRVLL
jgi:hypothetical protein